MPEHNTAAHDTAELVARRSYGKLVAYLATRSNNVAAAEDALSEAFTVALTDWPGKGCPANPEAWLLTVARHKLIDRHRREHASDRVDQDLDTIAVLNETDESSDLPDRRLGLMFACAHPAIETSIRAPLILQVILGLDAATIASAFLVSPSTMGKRLVRAKNKIREAAIPLRIPELEELPSRLDAVLEAIYAAFSESWSDAAGTDTARHNLTAEAFFLARLATELLPHQPEALGLLSLMLHAEARRHARRNPAGEYIPMAAQNAACWNREMIDQAEALLMRARAHGLVGRYQLEAAVQSAHVHHCLTGVPNWDSILHLYNGLMAVTGSPVVAINRALAVAEVEGASAALAAMPDPGCDPRLLEYQPYWAARAELLSKKGACNEARRAYEIALGLTVDPAVWRFLNQRRNLLEDSCASRR